MWIFITEPTKGFELVCGRDSRVFPGICLFSTQCNDDCKKHYNTINIRFAKCQIFGIWHTEHQYPCCFISHKFLQYATMRFHLWNHVVACCKFFYYLFIHWPISPSYIHYLSLFLSLSISSLSSLLNIFARLSLLPTLTKPRLEPYLFEATDLVTSFSTAIDLATILVWSCWSRRLILHSCRSRRHIRLEPYSSGAIVDLHSSHCRSCYLILHNLLPTSKRRPSCHANLLASSDLPPSDLSQ